jgi:8-hydroxy-5-deazaflavin:NADPH oxidoreductase
VDDRGQPCHGEECRRDSHERNASTPRLRREREATYPHTQFDRVRKRVDHGARLALGFPAMDVAVVGGTGKEGFALALRLAGAGHRVTIGSRDAARAEDAAARAKQTLGQTLGADARIDGALNEGSVEGKPVVIVTVPFAGMAEIYRSIAQHLASGVVIVDGTSPLMTAVGGRAWEAIRPWHGSAAEFARTLLPAHVRLVGAFHTVAAHALADLDNPVDSDVLVCGDDADAKATVGELVETVPGMRWVDCGSLENARIAETLTALLISINRAYKVKDAGFRIAGRETWGAPGG